MALRPFTRHQKATSEEQSAPDGPNEIDQFFSNDLRPGETPTDAAAPTLESLPAPPAEAVPTAAVQTAAVPSPPAPDRAAGWYPDEDEPGLMRYWDGFHLTGQVMHVHARAGEAEPATRSPATATGTAGASSARAPSRVTDLVTPPPTSSPAPSVSGPAPVESPIASSPSPAPPRVPVEPASPRPSSVEDVLSFAPTFSSDGGPQQEGLPADKGASERHAGRAMTDEANHWAEETTRAVAKAKAIGTPEAWQEAAKVAVVLSELAFTMQTSVAAKQVSEQREQSARHATERARIAAQTAVDANRSAQQTTQAAREAAEAAKVAERAAAEARAAAEQADQAVPQLAEAARVAEQAAAEAEHKAQRLAEIVARASTANTPAAWNQALKLSSEVTESRAAS